MARSKGVGEGVGGVTAGLMSGAANLYGPPAVDGRRVEAWVEGRGDDSLAVGENAAAVFDWDRKRKKEKKGRAVKSTSTSIHLLPALLQRSGSRSAESGGEGGNSVHGRVITHR